MLRRRRERAMTKSEKTNGAITATSTVVRIVTGDCRETLRSLPAESVQCAVTSPPYWGLRDYGHSGQIGLEATPQEYVEQIVSVFREVRRVLRSDGTLWLNIGDCYASQPSWGRGGGSTLEGRKQGSEGGRSPSRANLPGIKTKELIGVPWRVAFALQEDGWWLRQEIIWHKPNPMPESVRDRCTKAHESVFLLAKSERYYFDADAIKEPAVAGHNGSLFDTGKTREAKPNNVQSGDRADSWTRNKRDVWTIASQPYKGAHFAVMPPALAEPCVLAGSRPGDAVLDPFGGSGTVGLVAAKHGRHALLCEISDSYVELALSRMRSNQNIRIVVG